MTGPSTGTVEGFCLMATIVAPALRALLGRVIDYAGTFPPALLPRETAVANYLNYRRCDHAWMLRWMVIAQADVDHAPRELDGLLSVVSDVDEPRAAAIETKRVPVAARPTYCEIPISSLDELKRARCFAKIRTGGVTPETIPSVEEVSSFIRTCAELRLPFKATAGLHHPIRTEHPLTYVPDSPRAVMHGFLNVLLAACFAWHGLRGIEPILAETDAKAFSFGDRAGWQDRSLEATQIREARTNFAHAFGSCSFTEPVRDLEALGLL